MTTMTQSAWWRRRAERLRKRKDESRRLKAALMPGEAPVRAAELGPRRTGIAKCVVRRRLKDDPDVLIGQVDGRPTFALIAFGATALEQATTPEPSIVRERGQRA